MKITQLNREEIVVDELNSQTTYRVTKLSDGNIKAIPMSKVSVTQFIEDAHDTSVAYIEVGV